MALTQVTGARATWLLANRPAHAPAGIPYSCLVTDISVNDYLVGVRARVTVAGASGGSPATRTFTVDRLGFTFTVVMLSATSTEIIRP